MYMSLYLFFTVIIFCDANTTTRLGLVLTIRLGGSGDPITLFEKQL